MQSPSIPYSKLLHTWFQDWSLMSRPPSSRTSSASSRLVCQLLRDFVFVDIILWRSPTEIPENTTTRSGQWLFCSLLRASLGIRLRRFVVCKNALGFGTTTAFEHSEMPEEDRLNWMHTPEIAAPGENFKYKNSSHGNEYDKKLKSRSAYWHVTSTNRFTWHETAHTTDSCTWF